MSNIPTPDSFFRVKFVFINFLYYLNLILMPPTKIVLLCWIIINIIVDLSIDFKTFFICTIALILYLDLGFCIKKQRYLTYKENLFFKRLQRFQNLEVSANNAEIIPKSGNNVSCIIRKDPSNNVDKVDLSFIKQFYQVHPQKYVADNFDVPQDAYNLYGTVLMLHAYGNGSSVRNGYPVYFYRECHITDSKKFHMNLITEDYFCKPTIHQLLNSYTVAELKLIAEKVGCLKKGCKADLIDRIIESMSIEEQQQCINQSSKYVLSDKGRTFLNKHYDLVEFHRFIKYDIPFARFYVNRFPDGIRKRTFNDNVFSILSDRIYKDSLRNYYLTMEHDYYSLYEITLSEHMYGEAIKHYLHYFYLKTSCVRTAWLYSQDFYLKPDSIDEMIFFAKIALEILKLKNFYSPTLVDNIYRDLSLPPNFLSCSELKKLIDIMLNETNFDYQKYSDLINHRIAQYIDTK